MKMQNSQSEGVTSHLLDPGRMTFYHIYYFSISFFSSCTIWRKSSRWTESWSTLSACNCLTLKKPLLGQRMLVCIIRQSQWISTGFVTLYLSKAVCLEFYGNPFFLVDSGYLSPFLGFLGVFLSKGNLEDLDILDDRRKTTKIKSCCLLANGSCCGCVNGVKINYSKSNFYFLSN